MISCGSTGRIRPSPRMSSSTIVKTNSAARLAEKGVRSGAMLARIGEADVRVALLRHLQVHGARSEIDQVAEVVAREARVVLVLEFLELLDVLRADPAGAMDRRRLERGLDAVLVLQAELRNLELQLADRAEDDVVVGQRPVDLRRALFAELVESLVELLGLERIAQHDAAEQLGREVRHA